jgi:hypothetical protein
LDENNTMMNNHLGSPCCTFINNPKVRKSKYWTGERIFCSENFTVGYTVLINTIQLFFNILIGRQQKLFTKCVAIGENLHQKGSPLIEMTLYLHLLTTFSFYTFLQFYFFWSLNYRSTFHCFRLTFPPYTRFIS